MQINLKQVEIVEALKQFITKQGISLVNKSVAISSTAGRKDAGLSADIVIEDVASEIPGLEVGDEVESTRPVLTVVAPPPPAPADTPEVEEKKPDVVEASAAPAKATTSLFG